MEAKTFDTRIDIKSETRTRIIDLLNARLADASDLYSQAKQAHWNVKGSDFFQLHEMFDELAEALIPHIDDIAERVTALGGEALGTVRMAAGSSTLKDFPRDSYESMDAVDALAGGYATFARELRTSADEAENLRDMDSNDLLIEVSRTIDKHLWFLEAHLQKAR